MGDCCDRDGYDAVFGDRFVKKVARRYRRRGLTKTSSLMVDYLCAKGIEGASILEIGGGMGEVQVELLRRGAARVTNLEISKGYEQEAARLLEKSGMTDRVTRRLVNIAATPDEVEPADVVVLHRVVCCYPDYEGLLSAAGRHANRLLVFSHPPRNLLVLADFGAENLMRWAKRDSFRTFVHPPEAMVEVLRNTGLSTRYQHRGLSWSVVGLERSPG